MSIKSSSQTPMSVPNGLPMREPELPDFQGKGALPWGILTMAGLIAPWMLGGRAAPAPWVLGGLLWLAVASAVWQITQTCTAWQRHGAYARRRGKASLNPWPSLRRGLTRGIPFWGLIAFLLCSLANPAYTRVDGVLHLQPFVSWLPIVVDSQRSLPAIFLLTGLLAVLAVFGLPTVPLKPQWLHRILGLLLLNAALLTGLGFILKFAGNGLLLGFFPPKAGYFFASFYYKNHWAAYALLHCAFAAFFFFRDLPRWLQNPRQSGTGILALVLLLFLGLSLPVVDSRSGMLLFALFLALLIAELVRQLKSTALRIGTGLAAATIIASGAYLTLPDLLRAWDRTQHQIEQNDRVLFDRIRTTHGPEVCARLILKRPLTGWGWQSFFPAFPAVATDFFRDDSGALVSGLEFAHNDWLQTAAELGLLGCALLAAGLLGLLSDAPKSRTARWIRAGPLLLALLATWDFPFSNPSVLLTASLSLLLAARCSMPPPNPSCHNAL